MSLYDRQVSDVRPLIFSNDFSSEAVRPKLLIFDIKHPQEGGPKMFFGSDRIRTLVAIGNLYVP